MEAEDREEGVVHPVGEFGEVGGVDLLEHLFVDLSLGERGAVLHSHSLAEDALGNLAVGGVDLLEVDMVGVGAVGLLNLDIGLLVEDGIGGGAHRLEPLLDIILVFLGVDSRAGDADGEAEDLLELVPGGPGVAFVDSQRSHRLDEAHGVGAEGSIEEIGGELAVVDRLAGEVERVVQDEAEFRHHVLAVHVEDGAGGRGQVVHEDERVAIEDGEERLAEDVAEPLALDEEGALLVGFAVGVADDKLLVDDGEDTLGVDGACQVVVEESILVELLLVVGDGAEGVAASRAGVDPVVDLLAEEIFVEVEIVDCDVAVLGLVVGLGDKLGFFVLFAHCDMGLMGLMG